MHIKTFLAVLLFSLLSFSIAIPAFAASSAGVLVATVNIQEATIASQQDNTIRAFFTLTNGEGVQSGVRYGVQLYSETTKGKVLVDEKVYDETLNLAENTSVRKSISYTAPVTLSGSYQLVLISKNAANFPFAIYPLGKVTFTASTKGMVITPDSCTATLDKKPKVYSLKDTLMLNSPLQIVVLTCVATNTGTAAVSTVPKIVTKERSSYGEIVQTGPVVTSALTFKAGEKKSFSLVLPLAQKPQTYVASLSFVTGDISSNSIPVTYSIPGASATISNLSLDKDFYKRGETAALSLIWSGSTPNISAEVKLMNSLGLNCAKPIEQAVTPATIEVLIPITASCRDPHVVVALKDSSGTVLDQKEFSATTTSTAGGDKTLFIVVIIFAALAIAGIYLKRHKKSTIVPIENNSVPMRAILPIIVIAGLMSLVPFAKVSANTTVYTSGPGGSVQSIVSVNPVVYGPNDPVNITWEIHNNHTSSLPISLTAKNDIGLGTSNPSLILLAPTSIAAGASRSDFDFVTFHAPATPASSGSYAIKFETGVDAPLGSTIYVAITELTSDSGSVSMLCASNPFYPESQDYQDYSYLHTTYRADFFSDPQATTPLDVSGLGLQLKQEHSINLPGWISTTPGTEIVYTPISSGTSYTYDGPSYDNGYTDGYGPSSCDQQTTVYGYNTLDGSGVSPVSYQFVPSPPFVNLSAPAGAYQGTPFSVSWSSTNATSCVGTGFSTGGSLSGTDSVSQSTATTYTISCSNVLGTDTKSLTVSDWGPPPPPPQTCNGWPGQAIMCDLPAYCASDPSHPGYEVCQF